MRYLVVHFVVVLTLFALGCSEEQAPPVEPEPRWTIVDLGDTSQTDGQVRLALRALVVSDGTDETLSLEATVEKIGSGLIRYDSGGCGCFNPDVWIENEDGESCRTVRIMCPCWTDIHELGVDQDLPGVQQYSLGACVAGPSEAIASFYYTASEAGEWVCRSIEARLGVTIQASPCPLTRRCSRRPRWE